MYVKLSMADLAKVIDDAKHFEQTNDADGTADPNFLGMLEKKLH